MLRPTPSLFDEVFFCQLTFEGGGGDYRIYSYLDGVDIGERKRFVELGRYQHASVFLC